MVADVANFRAGGSIPPDLRGLLQGVGTSENPVRRRVMGDVPSYWEEPRLFPLQGVLPSGKDAAKEVCDGQADLSAAGCGNEGSRSGGGGDVSPLLLEYRRPIYRHLAYTGAMSGSGVTIGGEGVDEMVGEVRP